MDTSKIVEKIQYGNVSLVLAGTSGVESYEKLYNKPAINGIELIGNKTPQDLGIVSEETDPTVPNHVKEITEQNIQEWDDKVDERELDAVASIAKGANQAVSFENYYTMIAAFNALDNNVYNIGQNVMIVTLNVPDLWISGISDAKTEYTYITDDVFVGELNENGGVQIGNYILSALETQKVDLTKYVKSTDIATNAKVGLVKGASNFGTQIIADGSIAMVSANKTQIFEKVNDYRCITPKNLDYAVKTSITTNTETLTDEEKANAKSWLGVPQFTATQLEDGSYSLTINTEV